MFKRYDFQQMKKEIQEDEKRADAAKPQAVSQDAIAEMIRQKKRAKETGRE
ncbi:MAG: hypothetical protein KKC20_07590 [Proteobacteria bacterium]|nr:hypothetical protein [Pseudomonadota bacterium]